MLYEVYLDAIRNREQRLSKFKDNSQDRILSEASSRWIKYHPSSRIGISVGVDSSWNKRSFQGFDLYVVDAIAVTSDNTILERRWNDDIGMTNEEQLKYKAMSMEAMVADHSADLADIVSVDGSLISRFVKYRRETIFEIINIIKNHDNIIFISKTSDSTTQFYSFKSIAADIYYYDHIGQCPGFSIPIENQDYSNYTSVIEIYARLKECTPIIKIEIPQKKRSDVKEEEIKELLNILSYHSVAGYPYCLKLAHENCKINSEDIARLSSIYGLTHESQTRDALNE
jgi:DNA double-strand break repair nuclease NurA